MTRSKGRRWRAAALAGLLVTAASAAPAAAHDHRPPAATMLVGDAEQRGRPTHSSWLRSAGEQFCDFSDRFGFPTFRRALPVAPGDLVRIRLHKGEPPLEIGLRAWRRVDANGHPAGDSQPVPVALAPAGDVWEMRFVVSPEEGHLYLLAEAHWADTEGCAAPPDLGSQYASWTFHANVR